MSELDSCETCKYQFDNSNCSPCNNCEQSDRYIRLNPLECEHEFPVAAYECYCSKCNTSMGKIFELENTDLRAKLEAAEYEKSELLEAFKSQSQLLEQLAEDKFGGNWDGEIIFSRMPIFENGVKTDGITTGSFIRYDLYQDIKQERDNLQAQLTTLESKIRKAYQDTDNLPSFLPKPREKSIGEVIDILSYHNDQFWTIVGIIANYPTLQKVDEDLSVAVERLVELFGMAEQDRNNLLNQLAEWKEIAETEQSKWAEACTKFITNSPTRQLLHVLQEVREVLTAFISWKFSRLRGSKGIAELRHLGEEITDLQTAGETLLLVLGFGNCNRASLKRRVEQKNASRGYYKEAD